MPYRPDRGDMIRGVVERRLRAEAAQQALRDRHWVALERYSRFAAEAGDETRLLTLACALRRRGVAMHPSPWQAP